MAPRLDELPAMSGSLGCLWGRRSAGERPPRAARRVLDSDAGRGELVANGVRGREVLGGARLLTSGEAALDQRAERTCRPVTLLCAGSGPGRVERVDAEDVCHRDDEVCRLPGRVR